MFPVISLPGHAYLFADRVRRVDNFTARPVIIDTHNCELITPTFTTRSTLALANGMEFFSAMSRQEILSALDVAQQQAYNLQAKPLAASDRILIDPTRIVAILPYIAQFCGYTEEHGYGIQRLCQNPHCLIIMDDGDTCLAVKDTPAELVNKLSTPQQS